MGRSLQTLIRDLRLRRGRERRGLALAEGVRLVEEAISTGIDFRGAAIAPALEGTARGRALKAALERAGVDLIAVSDRELAELADTEQPQGVVAIIEPPSWGWADLPAKAGAVVLALDGVQDPGNVGTILRTTLALGGAGVIALTGTAELTNPKVIRGSMGALFRLPAISATEDDFTRWLNENAVELWLSAAQAPPVRDLPARQKRPPICLAVGNEGAGVSAGIEARAVRRIGIPLSAGAESINVAVAAGILLHELSRAR
jgi:TrmH family RNA methyltransferase